MPWAQCASSKYGALVQQANAIESLSNVNVLCLDKTGTLTANRLQVNAVIRSGSAKTNSNTSSAPWSPAPRRSTRPAKRSRRRIPPKPERCSPRCRSPRRANGARSRLTIVERHLRTRRAGDAAVPAGRGGQAHSAIWQSIKTQTAELTDQGLRVLLIAHYPDPNL